MAKRKKESFSLPFDIPREVWVAIVLKLIDLGWLAWAKTQHEPIIEEFQDVHWDAVLRAVKKYQNWAGLEDDSFPGPVTQHNLFQSRICGVPDAMGVDGSCKWPHREITVAIVNSLPGVSDGDFADSWMWAQKEIVGACGARMIYQGNSRTANIVITVANLGGPSGVLADQVLPCGFPANGSARMRVDSSELWGAGPPPWRRDGTIPLALTLLHEGLHGMGVPHKPPGPGGPAVMDPSLNVALTKLQPWDIQQLVTRYGAAEPSPPPAPPPTPPPSPTTGWLTRIVGGKPEWFPVEIRQPLRTDFVVGEWD